MTQKQRILKRLMGQGRVASYRLAKYCLQYNARIFELRKLGFDIVSGSENICGKTIDYYEILTPIGQIDFDNCKLKPTGGQSEMFA